MFALLVHDPPKVTDHKILPTELNNFRKLRSNSGEDAAMGGTLAAPTEKAFGKGFGENHFTKGAGKPPRAIFAACSALLVHGPPQVTNHKILPTEPNNFRKLRSNSGEDAAIGGTLAAPTEKVFGKGFGENHFTKGFSPSLSPSLSPRNPHP
ncbi:MAG: hypothetical protein J6D21_11860 [Clostridia bacterium]|nr:hypothetical protein [Clostridia bacterium]